MRSFCSLTPSGALLVIFLGFIIFVFYFIAFIFISYDLVYKEFWNIFYKISKIIVLHNALLEKIN